MPKAQSSRTGPGCLWRCYCHPQTYELKILSPYRWISLFIPKNVDFGALGLDIGS